MGPAGPPPKQDTAVLAVVDAGVDAPTTPDARTAANGMDAPAFADAAADSSAPVDVGSKTDGGPRDTMSADAPSAKLQTLKPTGTSTPGTCQRSDVARAACLADMASTEATPSAQWFQWLACTDGTADGGSQTELTNPTELEFATGGTAVAAELVMSFWTETGGPIELSCADSGGRFVTFFTQTSAGGKSPQQVKSALSTQCFPATAIKVRVERKGATSCLAVHGLALEAFVR